MTTARSRAFTSARYYDTNLLEPHHAGRPKQSASHVVYRIDGPEEWVETFRSAIADNFAIDPNLDHSYVNQLVIGLEREMFREVSVQTQYNPLTIRHVHGPYRHRLRLRTGSTSRPWA